MPQIEIIISAQRKSLFAECKMRSTANKLIIRHQTFRLSVKINQGGDE